MPKLIWDATGSREFETGTNRGVLYPFNKTTGAYDTGVAWNGLTAVTEQPSGAEATPQYADNIKYLNLMSAEEFKATLECFTYPDEFARCDGSLELAVGVKIGQQTREMFGLSYRTVIGTDVDSAAGYKIHLVYGAMASPSEKAYKTINDSPEAMTFSYEISTIPVEVPGFKPTSLLTVNSLKVDPEALEALEGVLYGGTTASARLPLPAEVATLLAQP